MMDKYVKLSAIERISKPMETLHKDEEMVKMGPKESYGEGGSDYECPECGTEVMATMDKSEMKCLCCGASMDQVED
jgi:rubrerythrin